MQNPLPSLNPLLISALISHAYFEMIFDYQAHLHITMRTFTLWLCHSSQARTRKLFSLHHCTVYILSEHVWCDHGIMSERKAIQVEAVMQNHLFWCIESIKSSSCIYPVPCLCGYLPAPDLSSMKILPMCRVYFRCSFSKYFQILTVVGSGREKE